MILESFLSQIETYLPKSRIQNDNADAINILNGDEDIEDTTLIQDVINCLSLFPQSIRESQLDKLLKCEAYSKIKDKREIILKSTE